MKNTHVKRMLAGTLGVCLLTTAIPVRIGTSGLSSPVSTIHASMSWCQERDCPYSGQCKYLYGIRKWKSFEYCRNISKLTIGKNVEEMVFRFPKASSLKEIEIDAENPSFYQFNGAVLSKKNNELLYCCQPDITSYTVPDGVTGLGSYAFENCRKLSELILSDSVSEISGEAFTYRSNEGTFPSIRLQSIYLGKNYEDASGKFEWADELEQLAQISVSEENSKYASQDGCLYSKDMSTLCICPKSMVTYKMPANVSSRGNDDLVNLEELHTSDTITDLSPWCQYNLKSLHIGKNVNTMPCERLSNLEINL